MELIVLEIGGITRPDVTALPYRMLTSAIILKRIINLLPEKQKYFTGQENIL